MIHRKLINQIEEMNQLELLELDRLIHKRIGKRITYVLRGKYWYAYVRVKDKQYWYYIGKELRPVTLEEILAKKGGK